MIMSRTARAAPGGYIYHAYNHGNGRLRIFNRPADYDLFVSLLADGQERTKVRVLSFCVMPTHWHVLVWPEQDGGLSELMRWVSNTHVRRWHQTHRTVGGGHIYQGRFRSFPIQVGEPLLNVMAYVEANALRAGFVAHAEDWKWSAAYVRNADAGGKIPARGPVSLPTEWRQRVNRTPEASVLAELRTCVWRGRPFGEKEWVRTTAKAMHLEHTLRHPWRPRQRLFA
jgi:putative transposase